MTFSVVGTARVLTLHLPRPAELLRNLLRDKLHVGTGHNTAIAEPRVATCPKQTAWQCQPRMAIVAGRTVSNFLEKERLLPSLQSNRSRYQRPVAEYI